MDDEELITAFHESDSSEYFQRPSWLLHDIEEMKSEQGNYKYHKANYNNQSFAQLIRANKESRSYIAKTLPQKIKDYQNFQKEKIPTSMANLLRLDNKKSVKNLLQQSSEKQERIEKEEGVINDFLLKLHKRNKAKKLKALKYMKFAQRPTSPKLTKRQLSPRPYTPQLSPMFMLPSPMNRPNTAPDVMMQSQYDDDVLGQLEKTPTKPKMLRSMSSFQLEIDDIKKRTTSNMLAFVNMCKYLSNLHYAFIIRIAISRGYEKAARRIQVFLHKSRERKRLIYIARIPWHIRLTLKIIRKRIAAKQLTVFLTQAQKLRSATIVKMFLLRVRKTQRFGKDVLIVYRARKEFMKKYWDKLERIIRKQMIDADKEVALSLQKERNQRLKSGSTADVYEKWNITNRQVEVLMNHLEAIQSNRERAIEKMSAQEKNIDLDLPDIDKTNSLIFEDSVDIALRDSVIEKYLSYKRKLHMQRIKSLKGFESKENNSQTTFDVAIVKKAMRNYKLYSQELLKTQLAKVNTAYEDAKSLLRAESKYRFLPYTDPDLGKPWKVIIEEVVRMDMIQKKRAIQLANEKALQNSAAVNILKSQNSMQIIKELSRSNSAPRLRTNKK